MKILVTGDKHLGLISDGMSRLEEQERLLQACLEILEKEEPDIYVDLGDLFDSPRPGPAATALAVRYTMALAQWKQGSGNRQAYILAGNHDKPTRGEVNALSPLRELFLRDHRYPRIVLRTASEVHRDNICLLFLPFLTNSLINN